MTALRRVSQAQWVIIAMIVGVAVGVLFPMDGTTSYLALASVFVARAAGLDMALSDELLMMGTLMVTSKGVAAVARASLIILSGTLAQFGLPLETVLPGLADA
jgi:proton glutamate symport protein